MDKTIRVKIIFKDKTEQTIENVVEKDIGNGFLMLQNGMDKSINFNLDCIFSIQIEIQE